MRFLANISIVLLLTHASIGELQAQPGQGRGFRGGRGANSQKPNTQGPSNIAEQHDDRHNADRDVFQFLLTNHAKIKRTVKEIPSGVETLTESDTPEIAAKIIEYVQWMEHRIESGRRIVFTMPNTAVKCGGAPQKIMYLADDHFRKSDVRSKAKVIFASAQGSLFVF